ncbi:VacJ family lipoprotein [Alteromonas sp. ASW11-19]|uniref:VacJ family lipoprotein n=1 Tax=Alteromonas salexigens TaxID=2982530 RepID=A0ABT2VR58_9ALTE|nr:VacJ family lipoprotein [Alteromonas salexigens]MCU7554893.1 VacJ family lipoprotein [Alteromonas salexigens]
MSLNRAALFSLLFSVVILGGCASQNAEQQAAAETNQQGDPRDPLEPVNRLMWDFNWEVLDTYLIRPVTVGYVTVMPQFARTGLVNAANNIQEPANFFNNLFQGKVDKSMDSLTRFVVNSTVGIFGTIDVATKMGIEAEEEEFGEVLGVWGVDTGPFLMLPALGPSDPRSFSGNVVDGMYYPMAVLNSNFAIARYVISALESRAALIEQEQQLEQAIDDYAFVKNAYFENLEFRVTDGKSGDKALDDEQLESFEEFESMLGDYEADAVSEEDDKTEVQDEPGR